MFSVKDEELVVSLNSAVIVWEVNPPTVLWISLASWRHVTVHGVAAKHVKIIGSTSTLLMHHYLAENILLN